MSHSIGQTTEDDLNPLTSQNSLSPKNKVNSNVSLLSDADYEFLFNQLLEGVAHGWHDRRIIKFFDQLGDRGRQSDWIAWLERLRPRITTLPIQSKRQLGTIMIRLGELTQSTPQVSQIGTASNRIGRELLFGNIEDVVWEYVGPDLILDAPVEELEIESAVSKQPPKDSAELKTDTIEEPIIAVAPTAESAPLDKSADSNDFSLETIEDKSPLSDLDFLEEIDTNDLSEESTISTSSEANNLVESKAPESPSIANESEATEIASSVDDESQLDRGSVWDVERTEAPSVSESIFEGEELPDRDELADDFTSDTNSTPNSDLSADEANLYPVAIDAAVPEPLEAGKKLDRISPQFEVAAANLAHSSTSSLYGAVDLDRSSIELIEGWFNLGLKQVSGKEFDKAIVSWEKALKINPNLSEAWHNRGSALGRLGRYPEAVESFQKALAIDPNNYQAWNDRAHALYQLEKWAAAADSWGNAIKITPANHLFWYNRGCALEQLESWSESISSYEKSLEIKPDFQPARSRYTNLIADNSRSN